MSQDFYVQCRLRRKIRGGGPLLVTWLPAKYAQKNKYLKLLNREGEWENGWRVLEVYNEIRVSRETIEKAERDWIYQRGESDV